MPSPTVAIIDIGSNSIKLLVASKTDEGHIEKVFEGREETRLGDGISASNPLLKKESMQRAVASVQTLLSQSKKYEVAQTEIVATSAVREAKNGQDFVQTIIKNTGITLRILSGETEARFIGEGIRCDPDIHGLKSFYLFDLGGGSLECLSFQAALPTQSISLPLGSIRLTEKWVKDCRRPFTKSEEKAIRRHVEDEFKESGFTMNLGSEASTIITGGTATNARFLITGEEHNPSPVIPVLKLKKLLGEIAPLTLEQRRSFSGLPPERADIFPTALTTLITLSFLGNFQNFRHSFYNLRYGIAAKLLQNLET